MICFPLKMIESNDDRRRIPTKRLRTGAIRNGDADSSVVIHIIVIWVRVSRTLQRDLFAFQFFFFNFIFQFHSVPMFIQCMRVYACDFCKCATLTKRF